MPVGRLDQPVSWLLVKENAHLPRSASLRVARNAFADATTLAVTALRANNGAGFGGLDGCEELKATGSRSASPISPGRNAFADRARRVSVAISIYIPSECVRCYT